jgi:phosphoglycerate dehydrogenase-like enzyme
MSTTFRVGVTRDFLKPDGSPGFGDVGLDLLDGDPRVQWEYLAENVDEVPVSIADEYDALMVLTPKITAATLDGCRRLVLISRFGVGYDNIDVGACTRNGVLLTITPDGVRRPVAVSALAFLMALSHRMFAKDRLIRAGRWADKLDFMGMGLTGRTLGVIGLGNIGREICTLARPFEMRHVAHDPYASPASATECGATLLELDELLRVADFVCVSCALTESTRHLLDKRRLTLMKPTAYLINVARGPIVDQRALTQVLQEGRIAGAALDVFEKEPIDPDDPLLSLENVILAPHAICWTDEIFRGNGRQACRHILDAAHGRVPTHVVNRDALEQSALREKLRKFAE